MSKVETGDVFDKHPVMFGIGLAGIAVMFGAQISNAWGVTVGYVCAFTAVSYMVMATYWEARQTRRGRNG